ncbi:MAG: carbohydrate-binding family 9-like protein [Acidobacteriaceae bacterium]|nr:carbohydrate-binding family 9-like protein [Acidobacteriaceae bacterium]MBV9499168.1 carbohydrate-binding family 9-like protein [Acidobacteriaceae bacterium]
MIRPSKSMAVFGIAACSSLITASLPSEAQQPCEVQQPTAVFTIKHVSGNPTLTLDTSAKVWKNAVFQMMYKDCSRDIEYKNLTTEIRSFWTDTNLYLLFKCPYTVLNLFLPPNNREPHVGLWDRDVVEMFLGYDWTNIRHYREFEIAPTGDWIDLAIDLDQKSYDHSWRSGWHTLARIDEAHRVWYAAAQIPLASVSPEPVHDGTQWRMNLYRIDGLGADPQRHFLCWQPTCVRNRDPNHVPEHFGRLVFTK